MSTGAEGRARGLPTRYLAGVELDHAQDILADLVGTIVTALRPTFRLAKLDEGSL